MNKGNSLSELKASKKLDYISSIGRAAGTIDEFIHERPPKPGATMDDFIHGLHKEKGTKLSEAKP
jgi:hypothetical protein